MRIIRVHFWFGVSMSKFVFTGDNHLRTRVWADYPDLIGDAYVSFQQIVDYCIAERCNLVLGGDVFDALRPAAEVLAFFENQLRRMATERLYVFHYKGNHDDTTPPLPEILGGRSEFVRYVDKTLFEPAKGIKAFALSYRSAETLAGELQAVPADARILMGHQLIDWSINYGGGCNMKTEWLPTTGNLKLVLLADNHVTAEHKDDNGVMHVYCGSTNMQNIGESCEKSFLAVESVGSEFKVSRIPLKTRPFFTRTAATEADLVPVLAELEQSLNPDNFLGLSPQIRKPILVFTISAGIELGVSRVRSVVGGRAHLFLRAAPAANFVDFAAGGGIVSVESLPTDPGSVLESLIPKETNPELNPFVLELLRSPDVSSVLKRTREGFGV